MISGLRKGFVSVRGSTSIHPSYQRIQRQKSREMIRFSPLESKSSSRFFVKENSIPSTRFSTLEDKKSDSASPKVFSSSPQSSGKQPNSFRFIYRFVVQSVKDVIRAKRFGTVPHPQVNLDGKVAIVTGASDGIGYETAKALSQMGAHVILPVRNSEKGERKLEQMMREIKESDGKTPRIELMKLDLSSLDSVRNFVREFKEKKVRLDILVNNAGLVAPGITPDGFEMNWGTNHLGHFLLTRLLEDKLVESAPSRVVVVSSGGHMLAKPISMDDFRRKSLPKDLLTFYGQSKLANIIFAEQMAERLKERKVSFYSLHPGNVASNIWKTPVDGILFKMLLISNREGAQTSIYCATEPSLMNETGKYYEYCKQVPTYNELMLEDEDFKRSLWNNSSDWSGLPRD